MGDYFDDIPNYTGPGISNGLFQTSVEFGDRVPKDILDAHSRLHDSAFAKFPDRVHRMAANAIYADNVDGLDGILPSTAGFAVRYGNQIKDSGNNLLKYKWLGPAGILFGAIENGLSLHDYMINGDKYKQEVLDYYKTDTHPELQPGGGSKIMGNKSSSETALQHRNRVYAEYDAAKAADRERLSRQYSGRMTGAGLSGPSLTTYGSEDGDAQKNDPGIGKLLMDVAESALTGYGPSIETAPVERGQNGMINFRDNTGFSYYAYKPPKRRKRKNKIHIDF